MALFGNKKKVKEMSQLDSDELPALPKLDLPKFRGPVHQLPQLPSNSVGEELSQNSIKDSVAGEEEEEGEEKFDEFESLPTPPKRITEEISDKMKTRQIHPKTHLKKTTNEEPIFVRIDKFEEGLNIFENARIKVEEMERILQDIKKLKDEEEKEIELWEQEISAMKSQIEKVDKDIFSRIK